MRMKLRSLTTGLSLECEAVTAPTRDSIARATEFIDTVSPYTSSLAIARSLLALSTLLTVLLTPAGALFLRSADNPDGVVCDAVSAAWSLFCMAGGPTALTTTAVVVVSAAVLSGFLPAVTAIPHWWVSWSLNIGSPIRDGGDQVAAVLTLLLVPLLLLDRRRNHWAHDDRWVTRSWALRGTAWAVVAVVWIQAAVLYANAAIAKFAVPEWANGTALWYWIQEPSFRPPTFFLWVTEAVHGSLAGTIIVNHGVLALELFAAALLFVRPSIRRIALPVLLAFHISIGVMFGLWSFFLSMAALLVLYLRVPQSSSRRRHA
jgi:antimicrobial peptide system SdpB family protein